jgi:thiamine kinase-like enzyme
MNIEEIIKQIPDWQKAKTIRYEPLSGGYSNTVYKVFVDGKIYALRINGIQNEFLGLSYKDEIDIIAQAARQNITPMVLECGNKSDFLITDFIHGTQLSEEQVKNTDDLNKVVEILKRIHTIPYSGKRCSTPFSLTRGYLQGAERLGIPCPADLKEFLKEVNAIEKVRQNDPNYQKHYCHNDPFAHNMMVCENGTIQIIDWELSGLGDIWFDLATVSFSCGFDHKSDEIMLKSYFGSSDEPKRKTLHDMKFVCMVREIGWALLHTALDKNKPIPGPGYMDFANSVLNRLKQGLVTLI